MNQLNTIRKKVSLHGLVRPPKPYDIISALLTFVCQRASILGAFPLGCAAFCAAGSAGTAYLQIPAILAGAFFSDAQPLKYLLASLFIWIYKSIIPENNRKAFTGAMISAGAVFLCGLYYALSSHQPIFAMAWLLLETIVTAIAYPVFANLKSLVAQQNKNEPVSKENAVSLVVIMTAALWGLSGMQLPFSIEIKTVACIYLILCITMYSNFYVSSAFGLICGFISCGNTPDALSAAGIFAVSAIFSGLLKHFGQLGAAVGFLTGITVSVLFAGNIGYLPIALSDIFIASALFAFIPSKINQYTGIFLANTFKPEAIRRDFRIKEYITEELNCFSNTFSEFARQFKGTFQKNADSLTASPSALFDETADRICVNCSRFSDCWQKNFNDTYKYLFAIYNTTDKTGYCDIHNAPIVFTQKCIQPDLFLSEFNHVYEIHKLSTLQSGARTGERKLVSNQYSEISKIISELSEEIEGNFFFDEQKEKQIYAECSKQALFLRDLNVVRDREGYYQMFFAPGIDADSDRICEIASEVFGTKMKHAFCKNKAILKLVSDNSYTLEISVFQKEKESEPVCGDTVVHFETDKNKYYIILCDGMGSGYDASKESRMTAELLSGFLKAGFSKNTALSLINSTLALKMDREGFSTIDLCEIDLRSGKTEFIKFGGAQSFIKASGNYETITAKGLPAGILEDIDTERICRKLEDGDMIVMVSDGVSEAGYGMMRGEWVKGLMKNDSISNDELAKSIVKNAGKKIYPRTPDDMTAVVVTMHKISENTEENTENIAV